MNQSTKVTPRWAIGIVVAISGLAGLTLAGIAPTRGQTAKPVEFTARDEDPKDFPAGAGRDDTFYGCTACHGFRIVAQQGMSRDRWDETLTYLTVRHKMPDIQGKDREVMLTYLSATYGPKTGRSARGWKNPFMPQ